MMISYASVERIEKDTLICEVEEIQFQDSSTENYKNKSCYFATYKVNDVPFEVNEGDIVIVKHDNKLISAVIGKDDFEKERRKKLLKKIMKK